MCVQCNNSVIYLAGTSNLRMIYFHVWSSIDLDSVSFHEDSSARMLCMGNSMSTHTLYWIASGICLCCIKNSLGSQNKFCWNKIFGQNKINSNKFGSKKLWVENKFNLFKEIFSCTTIKRLSQIKVIFLLIILHISFWGKILCVTLPGRSFPLWECGYFPQEIFKPNRKYWPKP